MRMNERGLSQGAMIVIIVGVVVAVVVPVTIVAVLLVGSGGGPGGLPVYSGASYLTSSTQGSTTSNLYDLGTAGLADVYNWYKAEMPKQEWTLTGDNPTTNLLILSYSKGGDTATITIIQGTIQGYSATKFLELSYTSGTTAAPC